MGIPRNIFPKKKIKNKGKREEEVEPERDECVNCKNLFTCQDRGPQLDQGISDRLWEVEIFPAWSRIMVSTRCDRYEANKYTQTKNDTRFLPQRRRCW